MKTNLETLEKVIGDALPKSSLNKLSAIAKVHSVTAGDIILNTKTKPKSIYLIAGGIIGAYTVDDNGKKYNNFLYQKKEVVLPLTKLVSNKSSKYNYVCLSRSGSYLEIDYDKLQALCKKDKQVDELYNSFIEKSMEKMEQRIVSMLTLDATQGYLELQKQIANVDNLIHQYQIASYLNVTPVQLSRVRRILFDALNK